MSNEFEVQYFSHLNGLVLGNNWGDLIRMLDKTLCNGIDFSQIISASINNQGDIILNLYSAHNALLFQVVELSGFTPNLLNQKYRIKGIPTPTQLILKAKNSINENNITVIGSAKLASLGYDIIFRDLNDVKRVYRSKSPSSQHPFIRVDETISDGTNSYATNYAKYAMVGLLEKMNHIDDFQDSNSLQLPFSPTDPTKNWKISGNGSGVIRGWAKWYWASFNSFNGNLVAISPPEAGNRTFTIIGNADAFYIILSTTTNETKKAIYGCGLFNSSLPNDIVPNWFFMGTVNNTPASTGFNASAIDGGTPLSINSTAARFFLNKYYPIDKIQANIVANPIVPDFFSGRTGLFNSNNISGLEIPFSDSDLYLRGSLKHIYYCGNKNSYSKTTPLISDSSIYVADNCYVGDPVTNTGSILFYLGEIE